MLLSEKINIPRIIEDYQCAMTSQPEQVQTNLRHLHLSVQSPTWTGDSRRWCHFSFISSRGLLWFFKMSYKPDCDLLCLMFHCSCTLIGWIKWQFINHCHALGTQMTFADVFLAELTAGFWTHSTQMPVFSAEGHNTTAAKTHKLPQHWLRAELEEQAQKACLHLTTVEIWRIEDVQISWRQGRRKPKLCIFCSVD